LGCPDWPQCTRGSLVAAHTAGDPMFHTWIEFGNRLVTVAITLIALVVFVAAWRFRPGGRRRRDLVWLAAVQPARFLAPAPPPSAPPVSSPRPCSAGSWC